jgi:hypothetical protein
MSPDGERPEFRELVDWLDGRLDPGAAARIAGWVQSGDPHTQRTVEWLRSFKAIARDLPLHEPPPLVRQSLNQYFRRWSEGRTAGPRPTRLFEARLMFDSRRDEMALAGTRAASDGAASVHLAFTTEVADVVLDAHPLGGGHVRLDGQVLPVEPLEAPVFEAEAEGDGFSVRTVDGDELGRFCLPEVPVTACRLRAGNGEITIVAPLHLREIAE